MKVFSLAVVVFLSSFSSLSLAATESLASLYANPGPYQVKQELGVWEDAERDNRQVPYKLYYPADRKEKTPIVIWSHGALGSREGSSYWGRHLASHGFAALHLQHPGTDSSLVKPGAGKLQLFLALKKMAKDTSQIELRFGDPRFAVDQLKQFATAGGGNGMLDTERMGIAGHSLGAMTTLVVAGQKIDTATQQYAAPEFKGALAMSPSARGEAPEKQFENMLMPIFHFTGTHDESPLGGFKPADRMIPFKLINEQDQYLLVLDKAVHMSFTGRKIDKDPYLDEHHKVVKMAAVSYWKMILEQDQKAKTWLQQGGIADELAAGDHFEFKPGQLAEK